MKSKRFNRAKLVVIVVAVASHSIPMLGQGTLLVDQASGTTDELLQEFSPFPTNQLAQSFTPSLSAVGFVQFSTFVFDDNNGAGVTFAVNLRQGAYNGPVLSSTTPLLMVNRLITQIGTFYFPEEVPLIAGQRYYLEPVLLSAGSMDIATKSPSPYLGGDLWSNGLMDPQADLWFREGVVVPEPGAVCLFLLGGGVLLFYRRAGRMA